MSAMIECSRCRLFVPEDPQRPSYPDVHACNAHTWRWLASTDVLQRESFGFDWELIGRTPANVAASLKDNIFAAMIELAEASVEFSWKHWAKDEPFYDRERVLAEFVDVAHFLANGLHAMDVTDEEWEAAYKAKQDKNRRRMATGTYSARKGGLGEGSDAE